MIPLLFIVVIEVCVGAECYSQTPSFFVHYDSYRIVKLDNETRGVQTTFILNTNGLLQYEYHDVSLGSLNKTTEDRFDSYSEFKRDPNIFRWDLTNTLSSRLKAVLDLKSGPMQNGDETYPPDYLLSFRFMEGARENSVSYWSEADAKAIQPAVTAVSDFLAEVMPTVSIDSSRLITQGDGVEPVRVSIPILLGNIDLYNGMRVKVDGIYVRGLESSILSDMYNRTKSLWINTIPSAYSAKDVSFDKLSGRAISVEGVFVAGSSGHLGMLPGEIRRITVIQGVEEVNR